MNIHPLIPEDYPVIDSYMQEPVSYTHLDVYKRQPLRPLSLLQE